MKSEKKLDKRVLAEGEMTGHAHRIDADVWEREDGIRVFEGETEIRHEEHHAFTIPAPEIGGRMASGIIMEWDAFAQEARRVQD